MLAEFSVPCKRVANLSDLSSRLRVEKKRARTQAHRHRPSVKIQLIQQPLNFHLVRLSSEQDISIFFVRSLMASFCEIREMTAQLKAVTGEQSFG